MSRTRPAMQEKKTAPGPDGLPYSAWRLLPEVTVDAMASYFMDIMERLRRSHRCKLVWIPKAKMGPEADNFRPLGMPNTLDRLVDGTIASVSAQKQGSACMGHSLLAVCVV